MLLGIFPFFFQLVQFVGKLFIVFSYNLYISVLSAVTSLFISDFYFISLGFLSFFLDKFGCFVNFVYFFKELPSSFIDLFYFLVSFSFLSSHCARQVRGHLGGVLARIGT